MPITQLPTPVPSRADPANFAARADAFLGALPTFVTEANALATEVNNAASTAVAFSNTAVTASNSAATNALSAAGFAGAQPWVSGQVYTLGASVYSTVNFRIYRRKSAGSSTTDPSADPGNWQLVNAVFSADNGNVGIGTSTPPTRLSVSDTVPNIVTFVRDVDVQVVGAAGLDLGMSARIGSTITRAAEISAVLQNDLSGFISFGTRGAGTVNERVRIDASGNVGINTGGTVPTRLHVVGSNTPSTVVSAFNTAYSLAGNTLLSLGGFSNTPGGATGSAGLRAYHNHGSTTATSIAMYTTAAGGGAPTDVIICNDSGNVGIGTTPSGSNRLTVSGSTVIETGTGVPTTLSLTQSAIAAWTLTIPANSGALTFSSSGTERMRIDASGNVGVGIAPRPWSGRSVIQVAGASLASPNGNLDISEFSANRYLEAGVDRYIGTGAASVVQLSGGEFKYFSAGTGSAAAPISFVERMRIDANGNLGLGISPSQRLHVSGTGSTTAWISAQSSGDAMLELRAEGSSSGGIVFRRSSSILYLRHNSNDYIGLDGSGNLRPGSDNTQQLGGSGLRWSTVFAGTGTINTSDARQKTEVAQLSANEIKASKLLAKEIGSFKFLSSIAEKGDGARKHIGMTVQRAIEIMQSCNLNPFEYGFICYDEWEDEFYTHPATEDEPERVEKIRTAGSTYGFRTDELLLFIARGFEARLSALEA